MSEKFKAYASTNMDKWLYVAIGSLGAAVTGADGVGMHPVPKYAMGIVLAGLTTLKAKRSKAE